MVTATLVVLAVLLAAATLLLAVAVLQSRARRGRRGTEPRPAPRSPALGSPAQVWLERGERVAERLRRLGADQPVLAGIADDADAVLAELRAAATEVADLDGARARLPMNALLAEQRRLDGAIAAAVDEGAAADLRAARDAVAARLALAGRHRAAVDALVARMRAAVAGMEQAEDELAGLLAAPDETAGETTSETAGKAPEMAAGTTAAATARAATAALADRLAGLRAGLAEVRAITARAGGAGQGQPGDIPGSVERPPAT